MAPKAYLLNKKVRRLAKSMLRALEGDRVDDNVLVAHSDLYSAMKETEACGDALPKDSLEATRALYTSAIDQFEACYFRGRQ